MILVGALIASNTAFATGNTAPSRTAGGSATAEQTQAWLASLDQKEGSIEFQAKGHPSALHIVGKGSAAKGEFTVRKNSVSGSATFDLSSLDTGIALRDQHMKEKYLQVDKYPTAKLTITNMNLPNGSGSGKISADNVSFQGTLQLHGVDKPVSGIAKIDGDSQQLKIAANFGIKMSDYGIEVPSFAGITIDDAVDVSVAGKANMSKKQ